MSYPERVQCPPGGKSSFSVGDSSSLPAKVRQPPGGKSSIFSDEPDRIEQQTPRKKHNYLKSNIMMGDNPAEPAAKAEEKAANKGEEGKKEENGEPREDVEKTENGGEVADGKEGEEEEEKKEEDKENGQDQTGKKKEEKKQEAPVAVAEPVQAQGGRKRVPPGGFSTKLW